ncbi:hypothetical protein Taro_051335 [Colocasia esculenta]|uniref:DUF7377 domain-containing protein n=1 Tax=Colocasia esculenta TaxID=4460 RepID=A0A843XGJ2_COLES|nr:hypothetical protein [Colocasia esculenta]
MGHDMKDVLHVRLIELASAEDHPAVHVQEVVAEEIRRDGPRSSGSPSPPILPSPGRPWWTPLMSGSLGPGPRPPLPLCREEAAQKQRRQLGEAPLWPLQVPGPRLSPRSNSQFLQIFVQIIAENPETVSETRISNVYSSGMVAWEVVTGEAAYSSYSPAQMAVNISSFSGWPGRGRWWVADSRVLHRRV